MLWKEERAIEISLKISNIKVDCIADPAERKKIILQGGQGTTFGMRMSLSR